MKIIQEWRPRIIFLVIGLVVGPIISSFIGWQVLIGTMDDAVRDAVVSYRAGLCAARARSDPEATADALSDFGDRSKLAEKWALLPGEEGADKNAVVRECNSLLAKT